MFHTRVTDRVDFVTVFPVQFYVSNSDCIYVYIYIYIYICVRVGKSAIKICTSDKEQSLDTRGIHHQKYKCEFKEP